MVDGLFGDTGIIKGTTRRETYERVSGTVISIHSCQFTTPNPDINDVALQETGDGIEASADNIDFLCPLNLPDGSEIISAIMYGNAGATAETWSIIRVLLSTGATTILASANIGTEDTTITHPVIENSLYAYTMVTSSLDTGDKIYGAKIKFKYRD